MLESMYSVLSLYEFSAERGHQAKPFWTRNACRPHLKISPSMEFKVLIDAAAEAIIALSLHRRPPHLPFGDVETQQRRPGCVIATLSTLDLPALEDPTSGKSAIEGAHLFLIKITSIEMQGFNNEMDGSQTLNIELNKHGPISREGKRSLWMNLPVRRMRKYAFDSSSGIVMVVGFRCDLMPGKPSHVSELDSSSVVLGSESEHAAHFAKRDPRCLM